MLRLKKSGWFASVLNKRVPLLAMLLIAAICAATLLFETVNTFNVTDGVKTHKVHTLSNNVEDAMDIAGFDGGKYKVLNVSDVGRATNVSLAYSFPVYISTGDKTIEINCIESTVEDMLKSAGYNVDSFDMVEPSLDTVISDTAYIDYANVDYVTGSYTEVGKEEVSRSLLHISGFGECACAAKIQKRSNNCK
jgi:uncharacterized protein YabE (DUF348 family)